MCIRDRLGPEAVLSAVDNEGFQCDGRMLEMNIFENRVYQLGTEDGGMLIAKFYRPGRWSDAAILEEHAFALDLAAQDIDLVPPLTDSNGSTLRVFGPYRFALFERRGGRSPDFEDAEQLRQLGRFIGRLHAIGKKERYQHRPTLDVTTFGSECAGFLLEHDFIPTELIPAYESLTQDLIQRVTWCYERCPDLKLIRTHGDCHRGNILWTDDGPHMVDLDDSRMAPAVQALPAPASPAPASTSMSAPPLSTTASGMSTSPSSSAMPVPDGIASGMIVVADVAVPADRGQIAQGPRGGELTQAGSGIVAF